MTNLNVCLKAKQDFLKCGSHRLLSGGTGDDFRCSKDEYFLF